MAEVRGLGGTGESFRCWRWELKQIRYKNVLKNASLVATYPFLKLYKASIVYNAT